GAERALRRPRGPCCRSVDRHTSTRVRRRHSTSSSGRRPPKRRGEPARELPEPRACDEPRRPPDRGEGGFAVPSEIGRRQGAPIPRIRDRGRDRALLAYLRRYLKMLTARAATSRIVIAEIADSDSIKSFARRVRGIASV